MTHITPVKPSNWCNIWPILHRLSHLISVIYGQTNTEVVTTAQERCLWFVLRLFYCLVCASHHFFLPPSLRRGRCFFIPFVRPSLSFKTLSLPLLHLHSNNKLLHSYKTVMSLPSELQKTPLPHPHLMPRLRCQICVSWQRVLIKHFPNKSTRSEEKMWAIAKIESAIIGFTNFTHVIHF